MHGAEDAGSVYAIITFAHLFLYRYYAELGHGMRILRYRVIMKYVGGVLAALSGTFVIAAAAALLLGERGGAAYYLLPGLALLAAGWPLVRNVPEREVTHPEAVVIGAISFLLASLAGALPFILSGAMGPMDAWFEAMNGFTTTGFSLLDAGTAPRSLLFFRALSQWVGGLGFVIITISLLMGSASVSARAAITMLRDDAREERLFPRIMSHVRLLVFTYSILTVIGVIILLSTGLGPFDAVCYTLSGISTGGFAVHSGSVGGLGAGAGSWALVFIMCLGAINFLIYYRVWTARRGDLKGALRGILTNPQVACLILFTLAGGALLRLTAGAGTGFRDAVFLAASAQTTTGYYTLDPSALPAFPMLFLVLLMFTGGSMGSSAGGIKLLRLIELFRGLDRFVLSQIYPRELVRRKGLENEELVGLLYVVAAYAMCITAGTLVFVLCGYEPLGSLFEVTSAASTVGLSSGIVSPGLPGGLKALLVLLMWAGRLEFMALMVWSYSLTARLR